MAATTPNSRIGSRSETRSERKSIAVVPVTMKEAVSNWPVDRPNLVSAGIRDRLDERVHAGVDVTVGNENQAVQGWFDADIIPIHTPLAAPPEGFSGRLVLVDHDAVLVSVKPTCDHTSLTTETALWSADTAIARILVQFL